MAPATTTIPAARGTAGLLLAAVLLGAGAASGAEIKVMTSGAFAAPYLELKVLHERATGDKIVTLATSMGSGSNSIPERLRRGEPVDVVIMDDATLDELIGKGRVLPGSKVPLARSSIGMAVRAGAPKPDISSAGALIRTLLEAKSIAYSASVSGRYLSGELFPRLGVAGQIAAKSKRIEGEPVGNAVARGEAEIGFQQVSELLPIGGIDYVGPLPPETQKISVFSAGIVADSKEQAAARAWIKFLASTSAAPAIVKSGMEPVTSR
jgi:molybdate transport system substrate-binding protein